MSLWLSSRIGLKGCDDRTEFAKGDRKQRSEPRQKAVNKGRVGLSLGKSPEGSGFDGSRRSVAGRSCWAGNGIRQL